MAKINYEKVNPYSISKMSAKEIKSAYSSMRSILQKRNVRMEEKGFAPKYPTPPKLSEVPQGILKSELAELANQIRDVGTTLTGAKTPEAKASQTMMEHGYDIPTQDIDDFGKFMEATRKKMGETYKGMSDIIVQAYEELKKAGVSGKTVARAFSRYLESMEDLDYLVTTVQNLSDVNDGKRVTTNQIKEAFG